MKHAAAFALVVLLALPAVASMEVHLDEEADFSTFRTYRWAQGAPAAKGGVEKQITRSVNEQLGLHDLQPVAADAPADLDVATFVLTKTNVELWSATATTSWGRAWSVSVRDITDGTLVVRLTRAGTQDMVWHVMVKQIIDPGQTSAQLERKVDRIIQKMFKKYPRIKKK